MARPNLLSNSVPRAELDHRARDARLRLVRIERLLVPRTAMPDLRLSPLIRFLGARAGGNGRRGGRASGSQRDSRLGCMRETGSAWFGGCGAFSRVCEAATVGRGPVDEIRCLVLQEPGASLKTIWSYLQPD
jgi:hypothetical protein